MNFENLQVFVSMGGHGPYVWTVYLTALVLLIGNFAKFRRERRRTLRELRSLHALAGHTAGAQSPPAQ